jgi:prepilin-type N-terminal cleavage/methylation domain-containing protein
MRCPLPVPSALRAPRAGRGPADDGFTLIEVLVSLGLIGLVGAFAIRLQVSSLSVTREHANREIAAELASEALDTASVTGGSALLAAVPASRTTAVSGVNFTEQWTVTPCKQSSPGGACTTAASAPGTAELARVVITVRWSESGGTHSEQAAALVSAAATDRVFPS